MGGGSSKLTNKSITNQPQVQGNNQQLLTNNNNNNNNNKDNNNNLNNKDNNNSGDKSKNGIVPRVGTKEIANACETGSQTGKSKSKQLTTINIYFGSNSGTSELFSVNLKALFHTNGITSRVINLEEFTPSCLLSCHLAIFLVATYGDGEPTDSAVNFAEWLSNKDGDLPADLLSKQNFMVFGLGNRTYEFFNRMGKRTQANLEKLGAHPLHPLTEGDASDDIDHDYENWRDTILPIVKNFIELQQKKNLPEQQQQQFQQFQTLQEEQKV